MYLPQVREEVRVVASEVRKEFGVFVYPQELAYDLDGEDLRVAQRWGRSAPSEISEVLDMVVYEAEDSNDEGVKIHKKKSPFTLVGLVATERKEVFSLVQAPNETCTRG